MRENVQFLEKIEMSSIELFKNCEIFIKIVICYRLLITLLKYFIRPVGLPLGPAQRTPIIRSPLVDLNPREKFFRAILNEHYTNTWLSLIQ